MRIAIVSNTSWSIFNFRRRLMAALKDAGHDVMAIGSRDKYLKRLRAHGIPAVGVPFSRSGTHPIRELRTVYRIRRALAQNNVDVVLSFTPKGNIYSAMASRGLGVQQVANVSGLGSAFIRIDTMSLWILRLYWFFFRRIHHVFFQNEVDREIFLVRRIVDAERTSRLPGSGVDLSYFAHAPLKQRSSGEVTFMLLGRLLWDKGLREYIEAARVIKAEYPGARFVVLGAPETNPAEGPSRNQLLTWWKDGLIEHHTRVDDVRPYLEDADCIVLPSVYREGVPRTLLEAAAMGRPVITCDTVGCRDAVTHGLTGFLCRPRDEKDLAAKMIRFITLGRTAWEKMGLEGRQKMMREFDEKLVIQRYLKILNEMPGAVPVLEHKSQPS